MWVVCAAWCVWTGVPQCHRVYAAAPSRGGKQSLPASGTCDVGSENLARVVEHPFTARAALNDAALARLVTITVRMLGNIIDISRYPLDQ